MGRITKLLRARGYREDLSEGARSIGRHYDRAVLAAVTGEADFNPDEAIRTALVETMKERLGTMSVFQVARLMHEHLTEEEIRDALLTGPVEAWHKKSDRERTAIILSEEAQRSRRIDMLAIPDGSNVGIDLYDRRQYKYDIEDGDRFNFRDNQGPSHRRLELEKLSGCIFRVLVDAPRISKDYGIGTSQIPSQTEIVLHDALGPTATEFNQNTSLCYARGLSFQRGQSWLEFTTYRRDTNPEEYDTGTLIPLIIGDIAVEGISMFGDIVINE